MTAKRTLVYNVPNNVEILTAAAELLHARGIVMLPPVGTAEAHADAYAWATPEDAVTLRINATGEHRHFDQAAFSTAGEYVDAVARVVLGEPPQCRAKGCTADGRGASGYCSSVHAYIYGGVDAAKAVAS